MRYLLLLFMGLLAFLPSHAQIDSLKNVLNDKNTTDYHRVDIQHDLAKAYWGQQVDSAIAYTDRLYALALRLQQPEAIAKALIRKSDVANHEGKEEEALDLLQQAHEIVREHDLVALEATVYYAMGKSIHTQPDSALYCYQKSIDIAKGLGLDQKVIKNKIRISLILLHQKRHQELSALYDEIIPALERSKDHEGLIETYTYMSLTLRDLNEREKSLLYADKALGLLSRVGNKKLKASVLGAIGGGVTGYFETFEKAEPLLNKSLELAIEINDQPFIRNTRKRLAILYCNNVEYDKAAPIVDSLLPGNTDPDVFRTKGIILYKAKRYNQAAEYYDKAFALYERDKAYIQQKMILLHMIDNKLALVGDPELTRHFMLLDTLTTHIHDTESKNQFFDLETKYRTAEKEAELQRQELELAASRNRITLVSALAVLLLGAGTFGIWYMRARQKRKELEHQNRLYELKNNLNIKELENLNNQLNPHEIKNLISSIAPELITKAPEAYKKMIKLFNVTRASLSDKLTEPLSTQLQQANDFLQLQQQISPYPWTFVIDDATTDHHMEIPRLLLKNMAENAVKYGMSTLRENGLIKIEVARRDGYFRIAIKDNGAGVDSAQNPESTGIGFSTYKRLFDLANAHNVRHASIALTRSGEWTSACINIPSNYRYQ